MSHSAWAIRLSETMLTALFFLFLIWMVLVAVILLRYGDRLSRYWIEPVLRRPVLIIESDDWGAGPLTQTAALKKLAALLLKFSDSEGRHPVMTLGMVLAIADTERMRAEGLSQYQRLTLDDPRFAELCLAITDGINQGVFSPQLHGMEHYWPAALMQAAKDDEAVRQWLTGEALPQTEKLPSALQSRWLDASRLPASAIEQQQMTDAVKEEVATFKRQFKTDGVVVVPPTFVWNRDVEQAWAAQGVNVIVTPGNRYEGRDAKGAITPAVASFYNGQQSDNDVVYLVRDDYFEPTKGHKAETALEAFKHKSNCGRPTLLETHRFNFVGAEDETAAAFAELERMLSLVSSQFPEITFKSSSELARFLGSRDSRWVDARFLVRVRVWIERLCQDYRLRKYVWLSGLVFIQHLLRLLPSGSIQSTSGER